MVLMSQLALSLSLSFFVFKWVRVQLLLGVRVGFGVSFMGYRFGLGFCLGVRVSVWVIVRC